MALSYGKIRHMTIYNMTLSYGKIHHISICYMTLSYDKIRHITTCIYYMAIGYHKKNRIVTINWVFHYKLFNNLCKLPSTSHERTLVCHIKSQKCLLEYNQCINNACMCFN